MVSINIGAGQGVTQAIASKLGLSKDDLKKINLSTWQNVMTEVSNAQSQIDKHNASNNGDKQKSIFTGGRDVKTINQQSNWKVTLLFNRVQLKLMILHGIKLSKC